MQPQTLLMIGFGAMGRLVFDALRDEPGIKDWIILDQPARRDEIQRVLGRAGRAIGHLDELDTRPDFALECAGHNAVASLVPELLRRGIDTVLASVGALARPGLIDTLDAACAEGGSQLTLVPGALAGIDALAAARQAGLDAVTYTGRKPPGSWSGTQAAEQFDLGALREPLVIFSGTAREAAMAFPQNANVAAMTGLAGIGLDETQVQLLADPAVTANTHTITASGAFGRFEMCIENKSLADNPKTSALAGMSIIRAVRNRIRPLAF